MSQSLCVSRWLWGVGMVGRCWALPILSMLSHHCSSLHHCLHYSYGHDQTTLVGTSVHTSERNKLVRREGDSTVD